ncbi:MAG: adenylate/guanylate cyclase domain-containing protein [Anaerolineales bacterium]|jgi:class 3 adenylate cyclase
MTETDKTQTDEHIDRDFLLRTAQTLNIGVAIIKTDTWEVVFENAKFFKWFPPGEDADEPVTERIPRFKADRAQSRLDKGRPYKLEVVTHPGGMETPIEVEIRTLSEEDEGLAIAECQDISKLRQSEYLLDSYSKMAEKNAREVEREKDRVERLLLNVMPKAVYEEMKDYGTVTPQLFEDASILMIDFVGHTEKAIAHDPTSLVTELNDIFTVFDRITDLFAAERIRTVGDAYMAVSGLPEPSSDHAHNIARVALRMLRYIQKRNSAHAEEWNCRIGINSGPVVGSLVGVQKYVYDIFGPGVNMAARMETLSEPMKITISEDTYQLLKDDFICTERGDFEVKGFGTQTLYYLERELVQRR